jgi:hypothetical protein
MPQDVPRGPANEPIPPAGSKEEFAARLRGLRAQAGSPSFRELAKITNYSSSTLADATAGRRLPTEQVLTALVAACGADPAPWVEELRLLAAPGPADLPTDSSSRQIDAPRRRPGRWQAAGLAAGTLAVFAVGFAIGHVLASPASAGEAGGEAGLTGMPALSGTPSPAPTAQVADGVDPKVGHCSADARQVKWTAVLRDGVQIATLDLMYSLRCGAGWARLYLLAGEPLMMGEVTVWSGDGRGTTFTDPLVGQLDDYTDVIVPGPGGCLGASGAVYETGRPVVTASIPCRSPTAK